MVRIAIWNLAYIWALAVTVGALAKEPASAPLFNGRDLTGWSGEVGYWSVQDGVLVGKATNTLEHNVFIWNDEIVEDFYLSAVIKLEPNDRNSGIQFRSVESPPFEAKGYQADMGETYWGRLYHETGRGKLAWDDLGERAVKPGEWNRVEILAVGSRIWIAINGVISVAVDDPAGERRGNIALQLHSGPPLEVRYKELTVTHNPPIKLADKTEPELLSLLRKVDVTGE